MGITGVDNQIGTCLFDKHLLLEFSSLKVINLIQMQDDPWVALIVPGKSKKYEFERFEKE